MNEIHLSEYNAIRPGVLRVLAALRRAFSLPEQPHPDEYSQWYRVAMAAWLAANNEVREVMISHEEESHG